MTPQLQDEKNLARLFKKILIFGGMECFYKTLTKDFVMSTLVS